MYLSGLLRLGEGREEEERGGERGMGKGDEGIRGEGRGEEGTPTF